MEDNNASQVPPSSQVPPQQPYQPAVLPLEMDPEARQWGMWAHLASFALLVVWSFGNVLGPLVVWLVKKDKMPFVNDQGKEALNFQITMAIAYFISGALVWAFCLGFVLWAVVFVYSAVMTIMAAMKAKEGIRYRYPYTLRLIK